MRRTHKGNPSRPKCNANLIQFSSVDRRKVVTDFAGGTLASDAGGLLTRETHRQFVLAYPAIVVFAQAAVRQFLTPSRAGWHGLTEAGRGRE